LMGGKGKRGQPRRKIPLDFSYRGKGEERRSKIIERGREKSEKTFHASKDNLK